MGFLSGMGAKLGLYRTVAPAAAPGEATAPVITKQTVSLKELAAQTPDISPSVFDSAAPGGAKEKKQPALAPRPIPYEFPRIYEAAQIATPAHGWTIERVVKLVNTDQFKTMPRESVKQSILGMLAAENVAPVEVVKDAISRDKAIDAFELHLRKKLAERQKGLQQQIEANRREIQALQAAMGDLEKQISGHETSARQEEADLQNWVATTKRAKEEELAAAVALLTTEAPITIGAADPKATPAIGAAPAAAKPAPPPPAAARPAAPPQASALAAGKPAPPPAKPAAMEGGRAANATEGQRRPPAPPPSGSAAPSPSDKKPAGDKPKDEELWF